MSSEEVPSNSYVVGNSTEIDPIYAQQHSAEQLALLKRRIQDVRTTHRSVFYPVVKAAAFVLGDPVAYYKAYQKYQDAESGADTMQGYLDGFSSTDEASVKRLLVALRKEGLRSAAAAPAMPVKQADHPQDRLAERTTLPANYTHRLRRVLAKTTLPKGNAYARMPDNSFAVFKDAGGKKRLASFLSKHMTPRGKDITVPVREGLRKTSATAVIIKGNPEYIEGNAKADAYYNALSEALRGVGYDTSFDHGDDFTTPQQADLWVGHSRGAGRLRFAPEGTATIDLGPLEHPKAKRHATSQKDLAKSLGLTVATLPKDLRTVPPDEHYQVTPAILKAFRTVRAKTSASVVPGDGKSRAETAREVKGALNTFLLGRGLDPDKATLVAGGAMYFNGLKGHITDVDFFHPDMPNFVKERVGRFDLDGGPGADIASEAHSSHKIHGLRVQTPSGMLAFYEHLNRPKDQEKIKLLRLLPDAQKTPADARLRKTSAVASTAPPAEARLRVAILNGSMNEDSRSRALATAYAKELRRLGADVDTLDMRDMGDLPDVITGNSSVLNPYLDRFQNSDAFVVSSPVHNWGPSSKVMGFLEHALDSDSMAYRPYSILSGAGSSRSALAMGGLANQLDMELKGIGIGAGVQAAGDDYDPVTNKLKAAIVRRARENAGKLYAVANAMRDGPAKTAEVYYHGSNKKLDSLRAGSWVTPHQEDALSFGVPWSSKDLVDSGGSDGRPPQALEFKPGREPKDGPVYVYKTNTTAVKDAKTNTGKSYDWNRQVTKDTPVTLVESHPSWKDKLLVPGARKTASIPEDAVAYSAVPDIASAMEHGLLSSHAIAARPDLLEIARPDPEQREAWKKRLASETRRVHRRGPNVFFTPPDPDKIGPQHYINKDNLKTVEVALGRLMRDQPDTRVYGLELVPFGTEGKREGYLSHKKLRELLGSDPKELWQHYDDPEGRYYASDVPHGAVVTSDGVIDPKYLKTSSDQSLEHLRSLLARFKKDADKSGYNYFVVAHGDDPAVGAETSRVHGQPDSVVREHKKLHLDFSKSIGAEHVNWGSKTASIPEDAVAY